MPTETFAVPTTGEGRRDYSKSVEFSTYATSKGLQSRYHYMAEWTNLPALPWPYIYASPVQFFDENHVLTYAAPVIPYHLYDLLISCETDALAVAGFYRFNTWSDIWIWNIDKWYGDMLGFGRARLKYLKGIKTVEGKYYVIAFGQYSEHASFSTDLTSHWLMEEVVFRD